jgi:hypothetical protein
LSNVPNEDIYQSGILSLYSAIQSVKPGENRDRVIARVIGYFKAIVKKDFRTLSFQKQLSSVPHESLIDKGAERRIDLGLVVEDFDNSLYKLVDAGKISVLGLFVVTNKLAFGEDITVQSKTLCMPYFTVYLLYKRTLKVIQKELKAEDFLS